MAENILSRGFTQVAFVDQYGEQRIIHRNKGAALRVKKRDDSVSHLLNRAAGELMGDRIRTRRLAMGFTLDALLQKAGLSAAPGYGKSRMWEIENAARGRGKSGKQAQGIRFGTLYAIALALECEPTDLMPSAREVCEKAGVAMQAPTLPQLSLVRA